jgi:peptide-methionine (S)-S-oxide reductase
MNSIQQATLGGGCFWCIEAIFQRVEGVRSVVSGYAGGTTEQPTYKQVCTGNTGHAEVAQISFDTAKISFEEILDIFWQAHDPTTLNRQGGDIGTQYRSAIYCHDDEQQKAAVASKAAAQKKFADLIVTEILPLKKFWPAEPSHQNYYNDNSLQPYCAFVISPKLKKLSLK